MNQEERRIYLIRALFAESEQYKNIPIPKDQPSQKRLLRALMNVRMPGSADPEFLRVQDAYLQEETRRKGIIDVNELPEIKPGTSLWKGDITRLKADAVVNAANSAMTGCYYPNHNCIDNCIHTYAGIQLRKACADLMETKRQEEPTGQAEITPGFNLPAAYVIHTVGPIVSGSLTKKHEEQLASCYRACLETAASYQLTNIVFCCISTGVFMFPNEKAAEIAIREVRTFLRKNTSVKKVIFNVFKDVDEEIYAELLDEDK